MIEQTAKVLRLEDNYALIEVQRQTACGSCSAKAGCGKSLLDNVFKGQALQLSILNTIGAKENDNVIVGLSESGFVQASFYLYIFPLFGMLGFASIADVFFSEQSSELFVIVAGIIGLFFGSVLARKVLNKKHKVHKKLFEPKLLKVISANIIGNPF